MAPAPARPARVRGLRVRRAARRSSCASPVRPAPSRYLVRLRASDGRHIQRIVAGPRPLRIGVLGYADHLTVSVTALSATGRTGPPTTAHA